MIQAALSRTPSLDLRWLRPPKDLPLPVVAWSDEVHVGGYYVQPRPGIRRIGPAEMESHRGILVVCAAGEPHATLAHEYRHHLQHLAGWIYDGIGWTARSMARYQESIIEYFTRSRSEMDALRYEMRVAPSDISTERWDWIQEARR